MDVDDDSHRFRVLWAHRLSGATITPARFAERSRFCQCCGRTTRSSRLRSPPRSRRGRSRRSRFGRVHTPRARVEAGARRLRQLPGIRLRRGRAVRLARVRLRRTTRVRRRPRRRSSPVRAARLRSREARVLGAPAPADHPSDVGSGRSCRGRGLSAKFSARNQTLRKPPRLRCAGAADLTRRRRA
jgi:hypothetical protein